MKVTTTWLEARKEPKNRPAQRTDYTVDGREGLMVRVFPSGAVSFRFRYSAPGGERRVMVLGEFGKGGLSLADAHEMHAQAQRELAKGLDPLEEREKRRRAAEQARAERAGADTVASLVEQFVHRELRAERWDESRSAWVKTRAEGRKRPDAAGALLGYRAPDAPTARRKKGAKPVPTFLSELGQVKAPELTKRQIIAFLDGIVDRGSPVTANRTYALLKQFFEWAAAKDLIPASPMAGVKPPGGTECPRDRILTAEEIRALWTNLDTADMAEQTRLALKLLLVTGQRRGELTQARWDHFDLDAKLWTIPVELLKSAHSRRDKPEPHVVPLSDLAVTLLRRLKELAGDSPAVLPAHASKRHAKADSEGVLSRAVRQNADHLGIAHWTPHDLRRTAASFMTKLGLPRLHVEKVLNHSTGDIAEVYDRHDYLPGKHAALERWGNHLQAIIEGREQAVVPMVRHG
ncbi:MAG: tyrosine-type recombinase/integrase [Pseudomonadota bacterium]|jgi:integrase|nr:tyrosine-type recombinase/integrase [Pseudomonadota bacterium]